jgi:hypothetical protein
MTGDSMSAIISKCGQYRYRLERPAQLPTGRGPALFIMLNPSTADATADDPTIRRCRAFAHNWGCDGVIVANLYALRATDPAELWTHPRPVGPRNNGHLRELAVGAAEIVCAWGAHARQARVQEVVSMLRASDARLRCLGITKDGAPRHPLYVRGDQPLLDWNVPAPAGAARRR